MTPSMRAKMEEKCSEYFNPNNCPNDGWTKEDSYRAGFTACHDLIQSQNEKTEMISPKVKKVLAKAATNDGVSMGELTMALQQQEIERLRAQIDELVEALEFVTMPITTDSPSVEGLLQTMEIDRQRAIEVLVKHRTTEEEKD